MKHKLLLISLMAYGAANAQFSGGIEQYYYFANRSNISMGPIAYIQSKNNWYAEARYNYEEIRTFSFYVGKVFEGKGELSYSLVPMIGGVTGLFNGGSVGLYAETEYKRFILTSQLQYTFTGKNKLDNFYFNWSEFKYQPCAWFYAGLAMQHTKMFDETEQNIIDLGPVIGFSYRKWTIPIYTFNLKTGNNFYVLGIIWEW